MSEQNELPIKPDNNILKPEVKQYGDILYDQNLYFHGIGADIFRVKTVFSEGILSQMAAREKNSRHPRPAQSAYNEDTRISLCISPSIHNSFKTTGNEKFGQVPAFPQYISSGISFIVMEPDNLIPIRRATPQDGLYIDFSGPSGYVDEIQVGYKIQPEKIVGIMLPKTYTTTLITDIPIDFSKGDVRRRFNAYLDFISDQTGFPASERMDEGIVDQLEALESKLLLSEDEKKCRGTLQIQVAQKLRSLLTKSYAEKYGDHIPTVAGVLRNLIPERIHLFDENGYQLAI